MMEPCVAVMLYVKVNTVLFFKDRQCDLQYKLTY